MNIHKIIYDHARNLINIEDKLNIATIFLFCFKLNSVKFSELLYTENHELFVEELNYFYKDSEIVFNLNLKDAQIKKSFLNVLAEVIKKEDADGFYKAVFEKDEYALAICNIVNYNFDEIEFKKFTKNLSEQLKFEF